MMRLTIPLSLLSIALLASAVGSCGRDDLSPVWVSPNVAGALSVTVDDKALSLGGAAPSRQVPGHDLAIWRGSGFTFSLNDAASRHVLAERTGYSRLVMVSFKSNSVFGRQLARDPLTLAHFPGDGTRGGFALMAVPDDLVLDGLAAAAHADANHACGQLNLISLAPLAAVDAPLAPPVYLAPVRLDAAAALAQLDEGAVEASLAATITGLETLGTRYHTTDTGLKTPDAVEKLLEDAAGGKLPGLKSIQVPHTGTRQKSLVVTIPGTDDPGATGPVVIIGAHMDSINKDDAKGTAPGADDDASGIASLVEIVRALAASGARFHRTIELHAYAAEEVGLIGSHELADAYAQEGRSVAAMFQIDMNSWAAEGDARTIYLVKNDTNAVLRRSVKDLLTGYLGGDFAEKSLASGTSDHRSWTQAGFPAVFPFEDPTNYNEALHTPADTSATRNDLPLTVRFVRLALVFLAHHAGIAGSEAVYDSSLQALRQATPKDLKLAVIQGDEEGTYHLSVAAAEGVKTVEMCEVGQPGGLACSKETVSTEPGAEAGGRAFFSINGAISIRDGVHVAIYGYDRDDKLVAERSVRLQKK